MKCRFCKFNQAYSINEDGQPLIVCPTCGARYVNNTYRLSRMQDWLFQCTECRKKWEISGDFLIEKAMEWYKMRGAERGKRHKTTCTQCQHLSPTTH